MSSSDPIEAALEASTEAINRHIEAGNHLAEIVKSTLDPGTVEDFTRYGAIYPPCIPERMSWTLTLEKVRNGWILHGQLGDYVLRSGTELLEALKDDIGLELGPIGAPTSTVQADRPKEGPASAPIEPPSRLKEKDRGVSTATKQKLTHFVHSVCGHKSNFTASGCSACGKRFCSQCFKCGCP